MSTAVLKWRGVKPEDFTSAPKLLDVKTFCLWSMYLTQVIEECWEMAPETKREDVAEQIASIRFKMHGWRLQLDRKALHFEVNLAQEDVKRPPRFKPQPPPVGESADEQGPEQTARAATAVILVATPEAGLKEVYADATEASGEGAASPSVNEQAADAEDDEREMLRAYIVQLRQTLDLPNRTAAARHEAAVILSRLRTNVVRVKDRAEAMWALMADRLSHYRTHSVSFVQHQLRERRIRQLLIGFREPAFHVGTAGARLQPVWIGCGGIDLVLRSWRELAPQIDWDSYLFGEMPPEESELAAG